MPTSLTAIEKEFRTYVQGLPIHPSYKSFHTSPQHDGSPHVEIHGESYHLVVTERGHEFERRKTRDDQELLYWLVDVATQIAATKYELDRRRDDRDGREIWFPYQQRLLREMKPEWGERKQAQHEKIYRKS